jgi:hypothetical protein
VCTLCGRWRDCTSGAALWGEASNHLELHWLTTVVVSVEEKAARKLSGVGIGKTNASEPLMKCREVGNDIKTGVSMQSRDKPGGCPLIGQVVSGMQAA